MVRFVLRNYAVRSGKAKRFVLRIIFGVWSNSYGTSICEFCTTVY